MGDLTMPDHGRRGESSPGNRPRDRGRRHRAVGMSETAMSREPRASRGRRSPTPDQQGRTAGPERLGLHGGVGGAFFLRFSPSIR